MTNDRWKEIERLFYGCIDMETSKRIQFLGEACADAEVRREVESLLMHYDKEPSLIGCSTTSARILRKRLVLTAA